LLEADWSSKATWPKPKKWGVRTLAGIVENYASLRIRHPTILPEGLGRACDSLDRYGLLRTSAGRRVRILAGIGCQRAKATTVFRGAIGGSDGESSSPAGRTSIRAPGYTAVARCSCSWKVSRKWSSRRMPPPNWACKARQETEVGLGSAWRRYAAQQ
jgi:hypothetical protein